MGVPGLREYIPENLTHILLICQSRGREGFRMIKCLNRYGHKNLFIQTAKLYMTKYHLPIDHICTIAKCRRWHVSVAFYR